jgi:hypothetical protein
VLRILKEEIYQRGRDFPSEPLLPGDPFDFRNDLLDPIDIPFNFFHRSQAEFLPFVSMTELTAVPRAVPGHPQEEAISLAGRSDRTLLKRIIKHELALFYYRLLSKIMLVSRPLRPVPHVVQGYARVHRGHLFPYGITEYWSDGVLE